jgi:putative SOS response-associated peptidase YedK
MAKAEATVEELVAMIERGELRLPEMQRPTPPPWSFMCGRYLLRADAGLVARAFGLDEFSQTGRDLGGGDLRPRYNIAPSQRVPIVRNRSAAAEDRRQTIVRRADGTADYGAWLDPADPRGPGLLRPCPADWLEAVPVSTRVNSPRNDDPSILQPEGGELQAQGTLL